MPCMHVCTLRNTSFNTEFAPRTCLLLANQAMKQQHCHINYHVAHQRNRLGHRLTPFQATNNKETQQQQDSRQQAPSTPTSTKKSQQPPTPRPPPQQQEQQQQLQAVIAWVQHRWAQLTLPQRAYTVVAGLVALATLPKALTLVVLLLERVLIGGLLLIEDVLLELLLKGGALLGVVAVVALLGAGVYVFTQKATK